MCSYILHVTTGMCPTVYNIPMPPVHTRSQSDRSSARPAEGDRECQCGTAPTHAWPTEMANISPRVTQWSPQGSTAPTLTLGTTASVACQLLSWKDQRCRGRHGRYLPFSPPSVNVGCFRFHELAQRIPKFKNNRREAEQQDVAMGPAGVRYKM